MITLTTIPLLEDRPPSSILCNGQLVRQDDGCQDQILSHNSSVEWAPEWTGTKRMGEWLSNIKDWAISRERYLGTPFRMDCPIAEPSTASEASRNECDEYRRLPYSTGTTQAICRRREIGVYEQRCSGEMVREPYVMDCWFDSGCASFAQWHYPFENEELLEGSFQ